MPPYHLLVSLQIFCCGKHHDCTRSIRWGQGLVFLSFSEQHQRQRNDHETGGKYS